MPTFCGILAGMIDTRNPYWLRDALSARRMTIAELARRTGISRSQIERMIPSDARTTNKGAMLPQVRNLHKIEDALRGAEQAA